MPKENVLAKNSGFLATERIGDNKQKISPNLAKRTDFLVQKAPILVGVTGFEPAASTSQTSRATNCATPRCVIFIRFLVYSCKWSNLWSKHFVGVFLKRQTPEKVSVYKGVFSMIARLFVALLFARSAFLPAGASPLPACSQASALPLSQKAMRTHPDERKIFDFWSFSVSGQIWGQTDH